MGKRHPVDIHVGARVRIRRTLIGMTQEQLGTALGITFQQVQKYEKGANRIGSSRLYHLSTILDVPVSYFFEEITEEELNNTEAKRLKDFGNKETAKLTKRETLELVRAYYRIKDPKIQKQVFELVKALSKPLI